MDSNDTVREFPSNAMSGFTVKDILNCAGIHPPILVLTSLQRGCDHAIQTSASAVHTHTSHIASPAPR